MSCFSAAIHRGFEIYEPQSNPRVGKPGINSGKCTIIGGSEFGIMGWYRAGVKLTWGFTKESLQDATHTPKTSLICGSRPPNIVDLPEFKGRLTTSTRYHDCRGGGKRISRRKKHLREPRRTTRGGWQHSPGPSRGRGIRPSGDARSAALRGLGHTPNDRHRSSSMAYLRR